MFNKELFISLCHKYNVELSKKYDHPMIVSDNVTHAITEDDVRYAFTPAQISFDYLDDAIEIKNKSSIYYIYDISAIAC